MWNITDELGSDLQQIDLENSGGIPHETKDTKLCELHNTTTGNDDIRKHLTAT